MGESEFKSQIITLLRKNRLLKGKSIVKIIFEILQPITAIAILYGMLCMIMIIQPDYTEHPAFGYPFITGRTKLLLYGSDNIELTEKQQAIIDHLQYQVRIAQKRNDPEATMKYFKNKEEMIDFFHDPENHRGVLGGLWFQGDPSNTTKPSENETLSEKDMKDRTFKYSISIDSDFVNDNAKVKGSILSDSQIYLRHGFTQIQASVDQAILAVYSGFDIPIFSYAQRFPSPYIRLWQKWMEGRDMLLLEYGGIFISAALFMGYFSLITELVMEKETKILEGMKMMGMNNIPYYLSYSISTLIRTYSSTCLILIIIFSTQLFYTTSIPLVIITYLLYSTTLLILSFIMAKFFDRSKFAGLISFFIILALSSFGVLVIQFNSSLQLLFALISPIGFTSSIYTMASRDLTDIREINWDYQVPEKDIIGMLILDIVLYIGILWYLENVMTGQFGTKKVWYFLFTKSYWIPNNGDYYSRLKDDESLLGADELMNVQMNSDVEDSPMNRNVKISIRGLRKEFKTGDGLRVAINDLNLNMYEGHIHAFLGPNGSGKSTTIGCLTGLVIPTKGGAIIDGYDTKNHMNEIRKIIGVCPQQDILWPSLTVIEHLEIYAALKGITNREKAKKKAKTMAVEVGLEDKMGSPSDTLSGGQKRKLCLGIAFIGRSKILFIDEATSGMDPLSRRGVWDFLLKYKKGRTIVLTTHFMDEADFLGDRIAIISSGKLRCDGSSLFLKNKFGAGYLLTISKVSSEIDTKPILEFVQGYIPESNILSSAATELSFRLPSSSLNVFSEFFNELENHKDKLFILHYGISVTTIEEVFLRLSEEELDDLDQQNNTHHTSISFEMGNEEDQAKKELMYKAINTNSSGKTIRQQLKGLLIKRFRCTLKDLRAFMLSTLMPLIIISAGAILLSNMGSVNFYNDNIVPLELNLGSLYTPGIYVPYSIESEVNPLIREAMKSKMSPNTTRYVPPGEMRDFLIENYKLDPGAFSFSTNETDYPVNMTTSIISKVWYNREYLHALPIYMNVVTSSLLIATSFLRIQISSAPFTHIKSNFEIYSDNTNIVGIIFFIIMTIAAFALAAASFGGNISQERADRIKRLLYISGCKKYVYWLSNLIWDYIIILFLVFYTIVIMVSSNSQFRDHFGVFFFTLLLTAFAIVPLTYVISYKFTSHGKSTGSIFLILFTTSLMYTIINLIIRIFVIKNDDYKLQSFGDFIDVLFYMTSPLYCLSNVFTIVTGFPGTTRLGSTSISNYWAIEYCGLPILFLFIHCIIWILWIMIIDYVPELKGHYYNRFSKFPPVSPSPPLNEDSDVRDERPRVENNQNELVLIKDLHVSFPSPIKNGPPNFAVYNSTLGIDRGTTFGLLGMNGAGKSTTLNVLSGDLIQSSGKVSINGYDILSDRSKALESMGMCPQFCALVGLLSAREQLWLYCRIKGIPEPLIPDTVEGFIHMMDLDRISNSNVKGYSGGNRRKVSLSIACLANPSLVILDEPSCGCDAQVRRFMWNVISQLGKNKVIILTTHSMEECEALCDRISIMKEGKFTCLGSIQHVKSKYGSGYSLDIKFKKEYSESGINIILKSLPTGSTLVDHHDLFASFAVPNPINNPIQLSKIFYIIQHDLHHLVDSYSVSQTSLEQIFLLKTGAQSILEYDPTDPEKEIDYTNLSPIPLRNSLNVLKLSHSNLQSSLKLSMSR